MVVDQSEFPASNLALYVSGGQELVVRRNRFIGGNAPLWLHSVPGMIFESNLVSGFPNWSISLANVAGARILNNTIWNHGKGGIELGDDSGSLATTGVRLQNNLLQTLDGSRAVAAAFAFEDYNLIGSGHRGGAHDLTGSPAFVDAATNDFRLAAGSPGIDAALADDAPTTDANGLPRVDDSSVTNTGAGTPSYGDLGAFEKQ